MANAVFNASGMLNSCDLLALPVARCRLDFGAPPHWRVATASAWRGGFGHALHEQLCVPSCDWQANVHAESCPFPMFFPSARWAGASSRSGLQVTPFALDVAGGPGHARVCLQLFGAAISHVAALLAALEQAGQRGVGPDRTRLSLNRAVFETALGADQWQQSLPRTGHTKLQPPPCPRKLTLVFDTPLRIRVHKHYCMPQTLTFAHLAVSLWRRAQALLMQWRGDAEAVVDNAALEQAARQLRWQSTRFSWQEIQHHSRRQKARMALGGVVGEAALAGEAIEPFWPLLWLGQWLHAGKGASYGFGSYRVLTDERTTP